MTIIKVAHMTDLHIGESLESAKSAVDFLNSQKLDGAVITGDLFDGFYHINLANKILAEEQEILTQLTPEEQDCLELQQKIGLAQQQGNRAVFTELLPKYKERKKDIENVQKKIAELIQTQNTGKESKRKLFGHVANVNEEFKKANTDIYAVGGNHDSAFVYELIDSIHFLELLDTPVTIKEALTIAGARNVSKGEEVIELFGLPPSEHKQYTYKEFKQKFNTPEKLAKFYETNKEYQRLKKIADTTESGKIDILLAHKGPHAASLGKNQNFKTGKGLEKIAEDAARMLFCGHVHTDPFYTNKKGYEGIRLSNDLAAIYHIDSETKLIEQIDLYKKVYVNGKSQSTAQQKRAA